MFAVGEAPAGFIDLRLDASFTPVSADMVQIEPVSGDGSARRVVFDPRDTRPRAALGLGAGRSGARRAPPGRSRRGGVRSLPLRKIV